MLAIKQEHHQNTGTVVVSEFSLETTTSDPPPPEATSTTPVLGITTDYSEE